MNDDHLPEDIFLSNRLILTVVIIRDKFSCVTTVVQINEAIQRKLDEDIKVGRFNAEIRDLIAFWATEIREIGYEEYIKSPLANSLKDHKLKGSRENERAIELNERGGRLVYKYYKNKITVKVIKITADHDYN
ncbi:MAG: hypothetical protein H6621_04250 [Halobacteriovoraceae bacterium]|nr:hypothetical protein [Halobacteriovoraceae bacterium]